MIAYKFLAEGRLGPFTGFRWPVGAWVDAGLDRAKGIGIHVCRVADLPYWIDDELWQVEVDSDVALLPTQMLTGRARLTARVPRWDSATRDAFVAWCALRTRDLCAAELVRRGLPEEAERLGAIPTVTQLATATEDAAASAPDVAGYAADACAYARLGAPGSVAYIAACAAEALGERFDEERARQGAWLARTLCLEDGLEAARLP